MEAFRHDTNLPAINPAQEDSIRDTAWFFATSVFVLGLAFYVATMCRTVHWWDSGELAANARVLGIAHRPGFPLYILIGRVFGLIPFGDYFYRINFISAVSGALSLAILGYVWLRHSIRWDATESVWHALLPGALALAAMAGTYSYWIQAVRTEVYAPNLILVTLLLACVWRGGRDLEDGVPGATRWFAAASLVAGLGLCLHNATFASVLPAVAIYLFYLTRRYATGLKIWLVMGLLFVLGLSVYLYLPVRALQNPPLNWGWVTGVVSPGWSGVAATDSYSYIAQMTLPGLIENLKAIGLLLVDQLQWGLVVIAALGIVLWWLKSRRWLMLILGVLAGNILVTAILVTEFSETNADIHGYLLPAFAALTLMIAGGLLYVLHLLEIVCRRMLPTPAARHILRAAAVFVLTLLVLAPGIIYAPYCNLATNTLAYDFGTESTGNLRPGAVVFLDGTNWDFVLRGLQYVEGWRSDLTVINRDLMPSAWYRQWLFTGHPDLTPYEIPVNEKGLRLDEWARTLAENNYPVYWEFTEIDQRLVPYLVPAGHLFELNPVRIDVLGPSLLDHQKEFERTSRFYNSPDQVRFDYDARMVWVMNLYRAGMYYEARGLLGRAKDMYQRALSLRPQENKLLRAYLRVAPAPNMDWLFKCAQAAREADALN